MVKLLVCRNIIKPLFLTQVQLQMYVTASAYCDFVTWTPHVSVVFRVPLDDEFITAALGTMSHFWATHVFPELRTRALELTHKDQTKVNVHATQNVLNHMVSFVKKMTT